jgi:chitinase
MNNNMISTKKNNLENQIDNVLSHKPKIIYYYQTFCGLKSILVKDTPVTHIHLAATHFGYNDNVDGIQTPYIHLNNYPPDDPKFQNVWKDLVSAKNLGIKVILMVGGAGSAFQQLFSDFQNFYPLLKNTLIEFKSVIDGVDLDVEEYCTLKQIKLLINTLDNDFGKDFIITMAPVQYTLENPNEPGMSGFLYKTLYNSPEGKRLDYFNVQAYSIYSLQSLNNMIYNGYPVEKLVMGMLTGQDFENIQNELKKMVSTYQTEFGGVFIWEYYDAPPSGITNPGDWANIMNNIIHPPTLSQKISSYINNLSLFN